MKRKGFTLIELLIVVTIIGILAVALVPRIIGGSASARDGRRQSDVQSVATLLEYFLLDNGTFDGTDDIAVGVVAGNVYCISELTGLTDYGSIPTDPSGDTNAAFGADCEDYVVLIMGDDGDNLTKYAVAAKLELPEVGAEFTYAAPVAGADYPPTLTDYADGDGYFIMY